MGQAITVRTDYSSSEVRRFAKRAKDAAQSSEVRRFAKRAKDAAQARRLLAIAAVLDGAPRTEAATIGGMDRQTLRDWVIRFNERGPEGLINIPSPGGPAKLGDEHKAFLARIVDEGPIPAIHGVVRWRACDLIMRLHEEFGLSVSDDTDCMRSLGSRCRMTRSRPQRTAHIAHACRRGDRIEIQFAAEHESVHGTEETIN